MKPGRELDALIASKVMHLNKVDFEPNGGEGLASYRHDSFGIQPIPHYSTSITAAWEVVEKMESMGWSATVGTKVCIFARDFKDDWGIKPTKLAVERAKSAPHAICLAALKAVGVETR